MFLDTIFQKSALDVEKGFARSELWVGSRLETIEFCIVQVPQWNSSGRMADI